MLRYTEQSNALTEELETAARSDVRGMLRLLRCSDNQVFTGFDGEEGLAGAVVREKVATTATELRAACTGAASPLVILSGCGTSGRLAFHVATSFASLVPDRARVAYLIAGGDYALLKSQERGEDDPHQAVTDLEQLIVGLDVVPDLVVYVGITCGLSAPYVAGQLDYVLAKQASEPAIRWIAGLVGFNPVALARSSVIEGWTSSFKDVADALVASMDLPSGAGNFIINPVVGPESVTGSTRMKGGSATKMLLEILVRSALMGASDPAAEALHALDCYAATLRSVYQGENMEVLARLVEAGGASLRSGAPIYYVGSDFGVGHLGIIDASECPPTYGASINDVRGFVDGGWAALGNRNGDLSLAPKDDGFDWQLSTTFLLDELAPALADTGATVVANLPVDTDATKLTDAAATLAALGSIPGVTKIALTVCPAHKVESVGVANAAAVAAGFEPCVVTVTTRSGAASAPLLADSDSWDFLYTELGYKLSFNALTTGAHVLRGKVVGNRMVDLAVSNSKLFARSRGIIAKYGQVDEAAAEAALLRSIYADSVPANVDDLPESAHIKQAMKRVRVVPTAILLAAGAAESVAGARALLDAEPMVGRLIASL
ncbi:glucokinase regulator family protein [Thecamonas trahens ATCC 50062]|uniref:Glucokinase regulator family protein n=1 Tax=Thecamonas trahens ATCC 50062 TaxID=461836 RepID=A0A0L0DRM0_THETB|nr:glucokinase regulator family protein [Thecamonas trahens ATCC 50062]KNC54945.1 glucokinase regulator family protein [Thecamonas trahens ATCC 50062]|eukprot:XP_013753395.1 glucokinase regulator family protein [Thecamonas trahens ATCC 50062]